MPSQGDKLEVIQISVFLRKQQLLLFGGGAGGGGDGGLV